MSLSFKSRIGAAEVPTDPMSMEESDVIIKLKPKKEWVNAKNKDELADAFKEALVEKPGIDFEFIQPIEMRFNELITGVHADLTIKIFGEDLDLLYKIALEVEKAIQNIVGAADIVFQSDSLTTEDYENGWDGMANEVIHSGMYTLSFTHEALNGTAGEFSTKVCSFPCHDQPTIEPNPCAGGLFGDQILVSFHGWPEYVNECAVCFEKNSLMAGTSCYS